MVFLYHIMVQRSTDNLAEEFEESTWKPETAPLFVLQLIDYFWNNLVQVANEGEVGGADDGCLGVTVDGNNNV